MTADDSNDVQRVGQNPPPTVNGLAVASLVLGIVWIMWIGSILALVFGYTAKRQIDQSPHTQGGRGLAIAGIVLGWVGVAVLMMMLTMSMTGTFNISDIPMMNRMFTGDDFSSNGERIYMTADTDFGERITYEGGPGDGMMSGMFACVDCHGSDGRGGERQLMMETFRAADIRWSTLRGSYTTQTVRRAITEGVGAGDRPLDPVMPRWQMSPEDLDDLVDYLQTLGSE